MRGTPRLAPQTFTGKVLEDGRKEEAAVLRLSRVSDDGA